MASSEGNVMDDEFTYSPGWCPICGDPEEVCEMYGGHPDILETIKFEMREEENQS